MTLAWIDPPTVDVPPELSAVVGGHPLVVKRLARRGILGPAQAQAFLDPQAYTPTSPFELPGMEGAAERLRRAIRRGERICVWGDFDVDGQTATTVLVSTLRELDADVFYHIPIRADESHGVNIPNLEKAIQQGAQLVLTCDTGITAHDAADYARERGVEMVITDHHELPPAGEPLPAAAALVNPHLLPPGHPLSTLPGVGVAYKLAEALYQQAGSEADAERSLDLVALGIVADLAQLSGDTRYLLQRGLQVLRNTQRIGLQAVLELAELDAAWLSEEHIGFVLGPRLNAIGRLGDANPVVELLTTQDSERAHLLALDLEVLNSRRKLLTDQVYQGALAQIDQDPSLAELNALVLAHPSWPAGVLGIVASRLVERFHKPAIVLVSPPGELARGSARSLEGVHITKAISAQKELLSGFGGHAMAAGLSLEPQNIPEFRRRLSRALHGATPKESPLQIDAYLPLKELTLDLVTDLERLSPFGPGNPPLVLASRNLRLASYSAAGRDGEHLLLNVEDETGDACQVVWWQGVGEPLPEGRFDLAYSVHASTYRGSRAVQVEWIGFQPLPETEAELGDQKAIDVVDLRQEPDPRGALQRLISTESGAGSADVVVTWCEAEHRKELGGHDRSSLMPAHTLVVWTTPPGPAEWKAALNRVAPFRVILLAVDPEAITRQSFLVRLAGITKHTIKTSGGLVQLATLAAGTAQREEVVRIGLRWLQASGSLRVQEGSPGEVRFSPGSGEKEPTLLQIEVVLKEALEETVAYRKYFRRVNAEDLVANA